MTKKKQLETLLEIEAEAREKIRSLRAKNKALSAEIAELENEISALICVNEALSPKADGEKEQLKAEIADLKEKLSRAEMKLSAREKADRAFKDNCCFALDFFGETIRECNKQDEQERNRADFFA